MLDGAATVATAAAPPRAPGPRGRTAGSWHRVRGTFRSIQAAIDAAHPGDWVLVGPGDWKERGDFATHKPAKGEAGWGVTIATAGLHLRGMGRNSVVVDGTKPATRKCSAQRADQEFGGSGGRSG